MLKIYNKYYLKGSSLIESVIAVTIIATCLLIAIRLYASVLNSSDSLSSYSIKFKVAQLHNATIQQQSFDAETYNLKMFSIDKIVEDFENNNNLKSIRYIAKTVSDTIVYNYLVIKKDSNE